MYHLFLAPTFLISLYKNYRMCPTIETNLGPSQSEILSQISFNNFLSLLVQFYYRRPVNLIFSSVSSFPSPHTRSRAHTQNQPIGAASQSWGSFSSTHLNYREWVLSHHLWLQLLHTCRIGPSCVTSIMLSMESLCCSLLSSSSRSSYCCLSLFIVESTCINGKGTILTQGYRVLCLHAVYKEAESNQIRACLIQHFSAPRNRINCLSSASCLVRPLLNPLSLPSS